MKNRVLTLGTLSVGLAVPLLAFAQVAPSPAAAASSPDPMAGHDMSSMPDRRTPI